MENCELKGLIISTNDFKFAAPFLPTRDTWIILAAMALGTISLLYNLLSLRYNFLLGSPSPTTTFSTLTVSQQIAQKQKEIGAELADDACHNAHAADRQPS